MSMGEYRAKVSTLGRMAIPTMENGWMELNMAMVFGKAIKETATSDSGHRIKHTVTVSTSGQTGTVMKANGNIACDMVKGATLLPMATATWVSTTTARPMAMASTNGPMETPTRESSMKA